MTSTELKNVFLWSGSDNVDDTRGVFLLVQTLEHHIITGLFLVFDESVLYIFVSNHEWVGSFANFTLKCLPEVTAEVGGFFTLAFDLEPRFKTV